VLADMSLKTFSKRLRKKIKKALWRPEHYAGVMVSHPKSGRTWLRVMLDEVGIPFECTHDGVTAARPFDQLTPCRRKMYRQKPVVFVYRDPRDTVVSYFFQRTLRTQRYEGTMSEFIRDPHFGIEKIIRFNLAWAQLGPDLPAFLPVSYETLRVGPAAMMRSIVDFINAVVSDVELDQVCANNTFEKMRTREATGAYNDRYRRMLRPASNDPESFKVRRGKIAGFTDYLTPEDITYCDDILMRYEYAQRLTRLSPDGGIS